MERALAVVEPTAATKNLVAEAGKLSAGVDAELILLYVTTEDDFADRQDALDGISDFDADYGVGSAVEGAEQFARDIGREVLGSDVEFRAVGRVGDRETEILAAARDLGADHVFVHGQQRSPTGKAVFGDLAQAIILNFDGPVTVTTGDLEE